MKATILYLSKSNKSALISVEEKLGPVMNRVSGFVGLPTNHELKVKDEIDIPASKVIQKQSVTKDGTVFTQLSFAV